jgi:transposase
MIDLYKSGITTKQVAERFGISVRSVTRLLRQYGVRRDHCTSPENRFAQ